jgi:hypothetical protein
LVDIQVYHHNQGGGPSPGRRRCVAASKPPISTTATRAVIAERSPTKFYGSWKGNLLDAAAGDFVAADATRRTDASLRALAATTGQEVTYTCVPPGSGRRIGLGL